MRVILKQTCISITNSTKIVIKIFCLMFFKRKDVRMYNIVLNYMNLRYILLNAINFIVKLKLALNI